MEGREGEGREGGQEGGKEKKKIRPLNHGPVLKLSWSAAHVKIWHSLILFTLRQSAIVLGITKNFHTEFSSI